MSDRNRTWQELIIDKAIPVLLSAAIAGVVAYFSAIKSIEIQIAKLETQVEGIEKILEMGLDKQPFGLREMQFVEFTLQTMLTRRARIVEAIFASQKLLEDPVSSDDWDPYIRPAQGGLGHGISLDLSALCAHLRGTGSPIPSELKRYCN